MGFYVCVKSETKFTKYTKLFIVEKKKEESIIKDEAISTMLIFLVYVLFGVNQSGET